MLWWEIKYKYLNTITLIGMGNKMEDKIEIEVKERFRITITEDMRKHLKLREGDNLWYEIIDGKVVLGKIEVNKKFIE